MGGSSSVLNESILLDGPEKSILKLMMPVYYTEAIANENELAIAHRSWQLILDNESPVFQMGKASNSSEFSCSTCICFFYQTFYKRLFDTHPVAEELFRDVNAQGKFLVRMITLSFTSKSDPARYKSTLIKLAEIHNERGVKATEYGIVGEVLFWSLHRCLGDDIYTETVHHAWIKIFSQMLTIMVPIALQYEMKDGSKQVERLLGKRIGLSKQEEQAFFRTISTFNQFDQVMSQFGKVKQIDFEEDIYLSVEQKIQKLVEERERKERQARLQNGQISMIRNASNKSLFFSASSKQTTSTRPPPSSSS